MRSSSKPPPRKEAEEAAKLGSAIRLPVGCEVKDNFHFLHCPFGGARFAQVDPYKLNPPLVDMALNVLERALLRLSAARTRVPRSTSASVRWEPMKDAPPVTRMFRLFQTMSLFFPFAPSGENHVDEHFTALNQTS